MVVGPDDASWTSNGYRECRDAFCDDASGANDRILADRDAFQDHDLFTYPGLVADSRFLRDQIIILDRGSVDVLPEVIMIGDVAVRRDEDALTDVYR